jgi:hypothetical protein
VTGSQATSTGCADPFLLTVTGHKFPLINPQAIDVRLADISHALGLMVRFNGHTKCLYTVAEHCVLVAMILRDQGHDAEFQMAGLLHDAAEAYIGDVPTPVKWAMDTIALTPGTGTWSFREVESRVNRAIGEKFKINPDAFHSKSMKLADQIALSTEARDLLPGGIQWPDELPKPHEYTVESCMKYMQIIHSGRSWLGHDDDWKEEMLAPADLYKRVWASLTAERLACATGSPTSAGN